MTHMIAVILFFKIPVDRRSQIDTGLIGDTDQDPQHIGQFVGEVPILVRILE